MKIAKTMQIPRWESYSGSCSRPIPFVSSSIQNLVFACKQKYNWHLLCISETVYIDDRIQILRKREKINFYEFKKSYQFEYMNLFIFISF